MSIELVPIFVDRRDGSRDLMQYEPLKSHAELTTLDSGDILIVGNGPAGPHLVGIEVKSIWDLLSSMSTGRLQGIDGQLPLLVRTYETAVLLYYGLVRPGRDGALEIYRRGRWQVMKLGSRLVPYGYLEAFLWDVSMVGVHVHREDTERAAAQWLGVIHRWWSKGWHEHKGLRTLNRSREISLMPRLDPREEQRCRIAAQLPGVGYEKAEKAAKHFASVRDMINADAAEWCEVKGIGKVIAKAVVEAVK